MLLAENMLRHGDLTLDRYHLPESDYRLRSIGGHQYYYFPAGTSLLSVPFVAAMNARGISAIAPGGAYDVVGELALDARLAAILMAGFATMAYFMARLLLPVYWSLGISFVSAFGTQVFSTASRSMWSDTWGITLVGLAVFLLLRSSVRTTPLYPPIIAMLEVLSYVVRPTNVIALVGTAAYIAISNRKCLLSFLATAASGLSLFFACSWITLHKLVPDYFSASRLDFSEPSATFSGAFFGGFLGNLVSPGRGLFVYVPAVIATCVALVHYRRTVRFRAMALLAGVVALCHLVVLSGFVHWWGGYSYGARLTTSLVPWFVLVAVIAADAHRRASEARPVAPADVVVGIVAGLLCVLSVVINGVGAFSQEANRWNAIPESIDRTPRRLWSWRSPQFMAPLVEPEGPFPILPSDGLDMGTREAEEYLGRGWADGEGAFRWTEGRGSSAIRFSLPAAGAGVLEIDLRAYLGGGKVPEQRLGVSLNDRDLATLAIRTPEFALYQVHVPEQNMSLYANVLRLHHPDAVSPADREGTPDRRKLGVAVRTVFWRPEQQP